MKAVTIKLFKDMAELTAPECATNCKIPHSCCDSFYCDMAEEHMLSEGITIKYTNHPKLKFMGPEGCTVEPHFRPLCTLHVCSIYGYGFKPNDEDWTRKYFAIRDQIENEMMNEFLRK